MNHPQSPQAAVAFIEKKCDNQIHWLLLQRSFHPKDPWSGQLCLPGGKLESTDHSLLQTAIRETFEETQIPLLESQVFLTLSDREAGGGRILVRPFLFQIQNSPQITLNPHELANYWWISPEEFMNSPIIQFTPLSNKPEFKTPGRLIHGQILWGFTLKLFEEYAKNYTGKF